LKVIPLPEEPLIKKIRAAFYDPEYPLDLILVVVWLAAGLMVIYLPLLNATPLRYVVTVPLVLFIPGYCFIAALFPKNSDISLLERVAFSVGLSLAIIPLIALWLNFVVWGIQLDPVMLLLTVFCLVMVVVAWVRRAFLPQKERFRIPFSEIFGSTGKKIFSTGGSRTDRFLSIILVIAIIVALCVTVYVMVIPREGERFTEFYILGENRMAADFPDYINVGQNYPMYIGVKNHENRDVTYKIETWNLRTESDTLTNTSRVIAMDPADYLSFTLADNQSAILPYKLSLREPGYDRVEFLLFNESVPGTEVTGSDRINASYRNLHLLIHD
jgi:uncharacterized membrane protein